MTRVLAKHVWFCLEQLGSCLSYPKKNSKYTCVQQRRRDQLSPLHGAPRLLCLPPQPSCVASTKRQVVKRRHALFSVSIFYRVGSHAIPLSHGGERWERDRTGPEADDIDAVRNEIRVW